MFSVNIRRELVFWRVGLAMLPLRVFFVALQPLAEGITEKAGRCKNSQTLCAMGYENTFTRNRKLTAERIL